MITGRLILKDLYNITTTTASIYLFQGFDFNQSNSLILTVAGLCKFEKLRNVHPLFHYHSGFHLMYKLSYLLMRLESECLENSPFFHHCQDNKKAVSFISDWLPVDMA